MKLSPNLRNRLFSPVSYNDRNGETLKWWKYSVFSPFRLLRPMSFFHPEENLILIPLPMPLVFTAVLCVDPELGSNNDFGFWYEVPSVPNRRFKCCMTFSKKKSKRLGSIGFLWYCSYYRWGFLGGSGTTVGEIKLWSGILLKWSWSTFGGASPEKLCTKREQTNWLNRLVQHNAESQTEEAYRGQAKTTYKTAKKDTLNRSHTCQQASLTISSFRLE